MNILDFIPIGHENAISRRELVKRIGLSDRQTRLLIESAREKNVIVNLSDGSGYYTPDLNDPCDVRETMHYVLQEQSRLRSIQKHLDIAYSFLGRVAGDNEV